MNSIEAKQVVADGLERRKEMRREAEREAKLEKYEREQIRFCNTHCADVKLLRRDEEIERRNREQMEARVAARKKAFAEEMAKGDAADLAIKRYGVCCLAILCLPTFTSLPIWAAVTWALGMSVFPLADIYRMYFLEG